MKTKILIITAIIVFILAMCMDYNRAFGREEWTLGDYISPIPHPSESIDCDDITLYSYYYIKAQNPTYKIDIMYGGTWKHYWLTVSDNQSKYYYDYGVSYESIPEIDEIFKGRRVNLLQLVGEVYRDLTL